MRRIADQFRRRAAEADFVAVIDDAGTHTARELLVRAEELARALPAGGTVALQADNSWRTVVAGLAVGATGGMLALVNRHTTAAEFAAAVEDVQPDAVVAVAAAVRPLARGEDHERALRRLEHVRAALRARALLEQHELAAVEVDARLREDGQRLEGKEDVAVEVAVQRVPVARAVAEDERRRAGLAGRGAAREELLVRTRERRLVAAQETGQLDAETATAFRPAGCDKCNNTGYKGRVGLYEVMEMSEELREMILTGASALDLRRKAREEGMFTLRESGLCKVREGVTSIEEVVRETVK